MASGQENRPFLPPAPSQAPSDIWPPPEWDAAPPATGPAPILDPNAFPLPSDFDPEQTMEFSEADDLAMTSQAEQEEMIFTEADDLAMQRASADGTGPRTSEADEEYPPSRWNPDAISGGAPSTFVDATTGADANLVHDRASQSPNDWTQPPAEPSLGIDGLAQPEFPGLLKAEREYGDGLQEPFTGKSEADELLAKDPEQQVIDQAEAEVDKRRHFAKRVQEEANQTEKTAIHNRDVWARTNQRIQRDQEQLRQDADALSQIEVDPERWFSTRSTGQTVAMYISVALGGFMAPQYGGKNNALDMIERAINRDIDAQKTTLQHQAGLLGRRQSIMSDMFDNNDDTLKSAETVRLALYANVGRRLEAEAALYDEDGTLRRHKTQALISWRQRQGEARAAAESALSKRRIAEGELEVKQNKQKTDTWVAAQKLQLERDKLRRRGRGGGSRKPKVGNVAEQEHLIATGYMPFKDAMGLRIPAPGKAAAELRASSPANSEDVLKHDKLVAETDKAVLELKAWNAPDPSRGGKPLLNADGKPFRFLSVDEGKKIRKLMVGAQKLRSAVDKLKALRRDSGGSSDILKSDVWQRQKAIVTAIDMDNAVNLGLGAISKDDMVKLVEHRGGVAPDGFLYDATAGLEAQAKIFEEGVVTVLAGQGYTGDQWKPVRKNLNLAHERKTSDLLSKTDDPVPKLFRDNEKERAKYILNVAQDLRVAAGRGERRGFELVDKIDALPDYLEDFERETIGVELVAGTQSISGRIQAIRKIMKVSKMNDGQRLNLRKNQEFMNRIGHLDRSLKTAGVFEGPGYSALDTYQIITGRKKDDN